MHSIVYLSFLTSSLIVTIVACAGADGEGFGDEDMILALLIGSRFDGDIIAK
jgi:hypothetical protein